jgi:tetratricopeptide (TPR) repeat protein
MKNGLRIISRVLACSVLILFCSSCADAGDEDKGRDPGYIFYKGNTLYEEGKYNEAIKEYSKLPEQGFESGNLYYNTGNCYFKTGDIGRAVLNYERARRLIPGDSDLESNFRYARSLIKGGVSDKSAPWLDRVLNIFNVFTINGLTVFLSAIFVCTLFFLIMGLFIHPLKKYYRCILPIVLAVFVLGVSSLYKRVVTLDREAIIISENVDAKFEPFQKATTYFSLYEGMKVYIIEAKKDWSKVERFDGKAGWITSSSMERI